MLERVPPTRADQGRLFIGSRACGGSNAVVRTPDSHGVGIVRHMVCEEQLCPSTLLSHLLFVGQSV